MPKSEGRNTTIDVLRLVAAFFVVYIHSGIFGLGGTTGEVGTALLAVARLAVPFFFIVSGYFIFTKSYDDQVRKTTRSIVKLAALFALSSILYFFFFGWYFGSYDFTYHIMNPTAIFNMIFFNKPFYNEALWFLLALIGATALHLVNARWIKKDWVLLVGAIVFYIAGLVIGGNYGQATGTAGLETMYTRNFLGYALLFTVLGYYIHKYQDAITTWPWRRFLKFLIISVALYFIEYYIIAGNVAVPKDIYFLTPVVTALVLIFCIKLPLLLSKTRIPAMGSTLALYVYILHIGILYTLGMILNNAGLSTNNPYIATGRIFTTFVLSLLIGWTYVVIKSHVATLTSRIEIRYKK